MRARQKAESGERVVVAERVRALIAASGLSQLEFASRIGTSRSRLSTYGTGVFYGVLGAAHNNHGTREPRSSRTWGWLSAAGLGP